MPNAMMAKPYHLSPRAETDLEGIWRYTLEHWSKAQADRYHRSLIAEIEALAARRRTGRVSSVRPGFLKRPCGSHVIWYRDHADRLDIIRILHAAQDVERHLQE